MKNQKNTKSPKNAKNIEPIANKIKKTILEQTMNLDAKVLKGIIININRLINHEKYESKLKFSSDLIDEINDFAYTSNTSSTSKDKKVIDIEDVKFICEKLLRKKI